MNGLYAIRQQTDDNDVVETATIESSTKFDGPDGRDLCRQEDAKFTDINYQLKMFGQDPFSPRIPQFGTVDYRIDKQQGMMAMQDAQSAYAKLPKALKEKYANWAELLAAAVRGDLEGIDLETGEKKIVKETLDTSRKAGNIDRAGNKLPPEDTDNASTDDSQRSQHPRRNQPSQHEAPATGGSGRRNES